MTARSLNEAIQESHAALGAISNGDVEPYLALYSDGDDITLGNPASIGLRVTSVYREEDGIWRLVHRHADPITTPQAAESVIGG
ncbi:MAG TPA: hypothetical protein VIY52_30175 [Streptosporangiaceae bacterium]